MAQNRCYSAKSKESSLLRRRKHQLVRRFGLPENALGGHLAVTYRRCGKQGCHCADGEGHPQWALSYSYQGTRRTEKLSAELAAELAPLVEEGRQIREAVMEVLAINVQLLKLWRGQERERGGGRPPRAAAGVKGGRRPRRR